MNFNTIGFVIFLPVVALIYFLFPQKIAWTWLLASSLFFYACWNPVFLTVLAGVALVTWLGGLLVSRESSVTRKKLWTGLSFAVAGAPLLVYKYFDFVAESWVWLAGLLGIQMQPPQWELLVPVGVSFFTLQALSYVVDVYRGDVTVERNPLRYLLFVAFFPQISSGPIGKAKTLLPQMCEAHSVCYEDIKLGILQMLWGFVQKLVIAEPISRVVRTAYGDPVGYSGFPLWLAAFSYGIQIYCDFAGYSNIAVGTARMLGFRLQQNFERPYFALTIKEFWRRWHISLSTWFRDYVYFPLGGSRCSNLKKYRNIVVVFLLSGLWHGAGANFLVWGGIHGLYQVAGDRWAPVRKKLYGALPWNEDSLPVRIFRAVCVFLLADFAWIFFRAPDLAFVGTLFSRMFSPTTTRPYGLTLWQAVMLAVFVVLYFAAELYQEHQALRKIDLSQKFLEKNAVIQGAVFLTLLFVVLIFGYYGPGYNAGDFIYSHF